MFFIILVAVMGLMTLLSYLQNKKALDMMSNVSGPLVLPFVGNAHSVVGESVFKTCNMLCEAFGGRSRVFIGSQSNFIIANAKDAEAVLNNQDFIEKAEEYKFLMPWLGTGLLTSYGIKWRKHRKIITPAFHFKVLESYIRVFNEQTDILVQKFGGLSEKEPFNLVPLISLYTLDVISETAMGVSINAQNDSESEYVKAVKAAASPVKWWNQNPHDKPYYGQCQVIISRVKNPLMKIDTIFRWTSDFKKQNDALRVLHGFTDKMIKERKGLLQSTQETMSNYIDDTGSKKKIAFLDLLLLSTIDGKPMDDISIREEVDTFLFEGHDTTTSALCFIFYLISTHPEVQTKLYEEQKTIYGLDKQKELDYSDLQNMKYLEMVIKEGLRLYPSVPLLARKVHKDTFINDVNVPGGSTLVILVYNLNRDPLVYNEPNEFIPERFLPDEVSKRSPYASVPFSAGSRNCIGQKFAMMEMKVAISKILRNYELLPSRQELDLDADLILKSNNGVFIKLKERLNELSM